MTRTFKVGVVFFLFGASLLLAYCAQPRPRPPRVYLFDDLADAGALTPR